MSQFENFHQVYGSGLNCKKADKEIILRYEEKLPQSLIEQWKEEGWCGYAQGLLWIINPLDLEDILEDWIEVSSDIPIVFARTAFADLFFWGQDGVHFLNVHYSRVTRISNDINSFFDSFLCEDKNLKKVLRQDIYQEALQRLRTPEPDECYAFVPALALGGSGTSDTLEKVKLREHIGFLAELETE